MLIAPSIDTFSAKNQQLCHAQVAGILAAAGLQEANSAHPGDPSFVRMDTSPARVERRAEANQGRPLRPTDAMVLQVSR